MNISFLGYGENATTFEVATGVKENDLVKMNGNYKVETANTDEDVFCGKALNVRGEYATVQLQGYMENAYSGTMSLGYQNVATDSNGKVKVVSTGGNKVLVVYIDTTSSVVGFIL